MANKTEGTREVKGDQGGGSPEDGVEAEEKEKVLLWWFARVEGRGFE